MIEAPMANAIFWTFSTIAQTLAGAIALLGAFALFKLQSTSRALDEEGGILLQPLLSKGEGQELVNALHDREYSLFIEGVSERFPEMERVYLISQERYAADL